MPPVSSVPGDDDGNSDDRYFGTEVRAYGPGEEKAAADRLGDLFRDPATFLGCGPADFVSQHEFGAGMQGFRASASVTA